jgi:hypothetical protein
MPLSIVMLQCFNPPTPQVLQIQVPSNSPDAAPAGRQSWNNNWGRSRRELGGQTRKPLSTGLINAAARRTPIRAASVSAADGNARSPARMVNSG